MITSKYLILLICTIDCVWLIWAPARGRRGPIRGVQEIGFDAQPLGRRARNLFALRSVRQNLPALAKVHLRLACISCLGDFAERPKISSRNHDHNATNIVA